MLTVSTSDIALCDANNSINQPKGIYTHMILLREGGLYIYTKFNFKSLRMAAVDTMYKMDNWFGGNVPCFLHCGERKRYIFFAFEF